MADYGGEMMKRLGLNFKSIFQSDTNGFYMEYCWHSQNYIVQNGRPRHITPREAARIQGYPDSYKLLPNKNAVYKQMGNGVSVPVIKAVITDLFENNDVSNLIACQ